MTYLVLNEDTRIVVCGYETQEEAQACIAALRERQVEAGLTLMSYRVIPAWTPAACDVHPDEIEYGDSGCAKCRAEGVNRI